VRMGSRKRSRGMTSRHSLEEVAYHFGLTDLGRGLDTVIQILSKAEENHRAWRLRRWATALIRHIHSIHPSSVIDQMKGVKRFFALCKENALRAGLEKWDSFPPPPRRLGATTMEHRIDLHQISRVQRSLRSPTGTVVADSLEEHWLLCQDSFETPEYLRKSLRRFIRYKFPGTVTASFSGVGSSSSYLRTKAKGGVPEEIKEITNTYRNKDVSYFGFLETVQNLPLFLKEEVSILYREDTIRLRFFDGGSKSSGVFRNTAKLDELLFPYDRDSELSLEDWECRREILFSIAASWSSIDFSQLPRCRQVPVEERGFKTRVATPLEAPFRYLLGVVNNGLLSVLECMPEVTSALKGRPAEKLDWSRGKRRNCVLSADLKSATDHFPQDLMLDAIDELTKCWPGEIRALALRAVGPHTITHHDGKRVTTTCRGILMGSPVSWPLLSIYSAWLHFESGSDGWFGVCGDDYIGCHTRETLRKYNSVRSLTGAVPSPGKDLVSFQSVGDFAEALVTVARGRVHPTLSVRAVLADSKPGRASWSQGPEVSEALGFLGLSPLISGRICRSIHKSSYQQLRRIKVDPSAPRWCGGAGFPGIPHHSSYIAARRIVSQDSKTVTSWVASFESLWSLVGGSELLVSSVAEDISRYDDIQWDSGVPGTWGPLRDVVASRLATLSWPYVLAGVAKHERRVTLSSVKRRVGELRKEVDRKGYWLPSNDPIRSGEQIASMLQRLEPRCRPIQFTPITVKIKLLGPGVQPLSVRKRKLDEVGGPQWGSPTRRVFPRYERVSMPANLRWHYIDPSGGSRLLV